MESKEQFALGSRLTGRFTRRGSLGVLTALGLGTRPASDVDAGKRHGKRRSKKHPFCLNGQTVNAAGKKKKKLVKRGATPGACPVSCACAANQLCDAGVCQTCTVTCAEDAVSCGVRLQQALLDGGTVYACPGRYQGNFTAGSIRLVGAGSEADASANTILDGGLTGRVLDIIPSSTVELASLRITRGKTPSIANGGGINGQSGTDLRITDCAIVDNQGSVGSGIAVDGALRLTRSTLSGNVADYHGGISLVASAPSFITDSVISGNTSTLTVGGIGGGGLYHTGSPLSIVGTQISNNQSGTPGGGIANDSGDITLSASCSITGNTAPSGGAIQSNAGMIAVNGATVSGNSTPQCVGASC
ncbi:MAG: hypothetical protein QM692_03145 [Thermomicrobiales bacterium]